MAMGELRAGKDLIKKSAEPGSRKGNNGGYTPFIGWKPDEVKSLFFITPIDEVPKVLMHEFVRKTVVDSNGVRKERWLTFMCRKDPAWRTESNNSCSLCDDIGHKATEKFVALAAEVDSTYDGKRLQGVKIKFNPGVDKDGNEVDYPAFGLVVKGPKFFGTLVAHDAKRDVSELCWEITREGADLKTQYIFYPLDEKPDLSEVEEAIPNLNDILAYLGSQEKYDNDLEGVTAEDQPARFGEKAAAKKTVPADSPDLAFDQLKKQLDSKVESYS
jgi:hypothetical protein